MDRLDILGRAVVVVGSEVQGLSSLKQLTSASHSGIGGGSIYSSITNLSGGNGCELMLTNPSIQTKWTPLNQAMSYRWGRLSCSLQGDYHANPLAAIDNYLSLSGAD